MQFSFWFWGRGERELEPLKRGERVKKGWEPLIYMLVMGKFQSFLRFKSRFKHLFWAIPQSKDSLFVAIWFGPWYSTAESLLVVGRQSFSVFSCFACWVNPKNNTKFVKRRVSVASEARWLGLTLNNNNRLTSEDVGTLGYGQGRVKHLVGPTHFTMPGPQL